MQLSNILFYRYNSLRKAGHLKGKGQPWPPFKPPGPVKECYRAMYRILHCKTMHALIFTVLHKVSGGSRASLYRLHLK